MKFLLRHTKKQFQVCSEEGVIVMKYNPESFLCELHVHSSFTFGRGFWKACRASTSGAAVLQLKYLRDKFIFVTCKKQSTSEMNMPYFVPILTTRLGSSMMLGFSKNC